MPNLVLYLAFSDYFFCFAMKTLLEVGLMCLQGILNAKKGLIPSSIHGS